MENSDIKTYWSRIRLLLKAHPWHGVPIGANAPQVVTTYIEIVPTDTVKYEIEKHSGFLKVDRPQKYSNVCPALYGFIPQTLCAAGVADYCMNKTGRKGIVGDGDPMDICVLTEKEISHSNILIRAIPIGGLRMIDGDEADDKIIAVMEGDGIFGSWKNIGDCPESMIERLKHYFLTYKDAPGAGTKRNCEITHVYDCTEAHDVITRSYEDYMEKYSELDALLKDII